jgi:hypothetical protein
MISSNGVGTEADEDPWGGLWVAAIELSGLASAVGQQRRADRADFRLPPDEESR